MGVELTAVGFLNGGLYPDLHRPEPTQLALLDPEQGPQISTFINEELFAMALGPTFAPGFDASAVSADIWRATARDGGQALAHRLIAYIPDRALHEERWVGALQTTDVLLAFVWGMLDPVSGAHMAERIRERLPRAPFLALDEVAHWPQLEAPAQVAVALLDSE
jgi:pimeloyl-ACP methyl ester carboxylesterase